MADWLDLVKCSQCPMCGSDPFMLAPGLAQCWCANEDCEVFMWDPWVPAAANLADIGTVKWITNPPADTPDL